jgi:hypothetical protein
VEGYATGFAWALGRCVFPRREENIKSALSWKAGAKLFRARRFRMQDGLNAQLQCARCGRAASVAEPKGNDNLSQRE